MGRMSELPTNPSAAAEAVDRWGFDRNGTLVRDTPCRRCAYNLRGLADDGRCPECSLEVAQSIRDELLTNADPNWITGIARGLWFIRFGAACIAIVLLLQIAIASVAPGLPGWIGRVFDTLAIFSFALVLLGAWRAVAPEPGVVRTRHARLHALAVRFGVAATPVLVGIAWQLPRVFVLPIGTNWTLITAGLHAYVLLAGVIFACAGASLLASLANLSARTNTDNLRVRLRVASIALPLCVFIVFLVTAAELIRDIVLLLAGTDLTVGGVRFVLELLQLASTASFFGLLVVLLAALVWMHQLRQTLLLFVEFATYRVRMQREDKSAAAGQDNPAD